MKREERERKTRQGRTKGAGKSEGAVIAAERKQRGEGMRRKGEMIRRKKEEGREERARR